MIVDRAMFSAKADRWREIEKTLRDCADCKKTMEIHDFMEVDPCEEHKPLALELKQLVDEGAR